MSAPATATPAQAAERKALGAYYTPQPLADALVKWAVDQQTQRVLDPSFGDGRFLAAAASRLRDLGVRAPARRLYGAELDPAAAAAPTALQELSVPDGQLVTANFFATDLKTWGGERFGAIVGNPPYVRHHLLDADAKQLARAHAERVGIALSERSDAWAYFCAALLDYLEPQGRLAVLLPGAVLHADYALPLLFKLSAARGRVRLVRIEARLFPDALERTVVLLVDGRHPETGVDYREARDIDGLTRLLAEPSKPAPSARTRVELAPDSVTSPKLRLQTRLRWFLSPASAKLWEEVVALPEVRDLGELARLRIGVVTGANRFFVHKARNIAKLRCAAVRTVPIVSRGSWLAAPRWTTAEHRFPGRDDMQLLLIDPSKRPASTLRAHIEAGKRQGLADRYHCANRDTWYSLTDTAAPDLFLAYMGATPPRLVVNVMGATCTNAIHRVDLTNGQIGAAALAVASWTSLAQLSAELVGRSYGGGVLKLELGEAALLKLPIIPGASQALAEVEAAFATGGPHAARERADDLILRQGLGLTRKEVTRISADAAQLQRRRGH